MKKILIVSIAVIATVFISVLALKRVFGTQDATANSTIHKFYDLKGVASGTDYLRIENTVENLSGVSSCVINSATRILAVSYFPAVQKEDNIIEKVKSLGFDLSYHAFKTNPNVKTCPVTGPNSLYGKFKSFIIAL